ncbi:transcriptional regulator [Prauserella marina]|uniref:Regulatory protein, tetR family n=1 Tax=Prauserella marina TaxID=530584 RepID=A0A222VWC3_9PSEU|nr:TetR/AcrR family transcriptional regulator C-terminal domain-containing protein [Prauserella marina]ASR38021.1 transcriptional regulator [Prauserella marina]PWV73256.1 TetR family transcriptional regulator [Prauserella marina]SDD68038.1 regulatory protein, tetR family [Prauserella marina]
MPRPRSLDKDRIATAALAVIDAHGPAGLSMRAVANQLAMSPMALYRYVEDRDELETLVVEKVLAEADSEPPSRGSWQERVAYLMEQVRAAVSAHPAVVPLTLSRRHSSPSLRRWSETVLGVLTEAGLEGPRKAVALRCLLGYLVGAIQLDHLGPLAGHGTSALADLPSAEFPYLSATAREARHLGAEEEFAGGLAMVLRGITDDS